MRRLAKWLVGLAVVGVVALAAAFGIARWLTRDSVAVPVHEASAERGAKIFAAAGCASCHTAEGADAVALAGGRALATPFGTFYGPNITPDVEHGIGGWSDEDFLRALGQGVAPDGSDLYPAFPYPSYARMTPEDMLDLKAHLFAQPASATPSRPHELGFPYSIRPALTFWKLLNFAAGPERAVAGRDEAWHRGRYLVRALAHCGECHTPRDGMGAPVEALALAGNPEGPSGDPVPNITPHPATGIGGWSETDLRYFLLTGMTPSGDFVAGEMSEVIAGTAKIGDADRAAIAAYLMSLAPVDNQVGPPRPTPAEDGGGEAWD